MAVTQKYTGRTWSVPGGMAVGAGMSLGITAGAVGILAKLVDTETIAWENIGYGVMVMLLVASFFGALFAYGRIKRQRLLVCLLTGMVFFAILMSLTALFFGGQYDGALLTLLLILVGSGAAGVLGLRKGRGDHRKHLRRRM